jgi:hypothetical protein
MELFYNENKTVSLYEEEITDESDLGYTRENAG